jgi:TIR domain
MPHHKIFLAYRRGDADFISSTLFDRLIRELGEESVFRDFTSIPIGVDFRESIERAVLEAEIFILVIWPQFNRENKLNNEGDFIRYEAELALQHGIPIIPVLVGGATFPNEHEMPSSLQEIRYRQAVAIPSGSAFDAALASLTESIKQFTKTKRFNPPDIRTPSPQTVLPASPARKLDASKSVFISYRRDGGAETARLMRYELRERAFEPFLDVEDLPSGHFDSYLLEKISTSASFLLIVSRNVFEGCKSEDDWLRKEVSTALEKRRNIVPLVKEDAKPPNVAELPDVLHELPRFNCIKYSHDYYEATINKLIQFLAQTKNEQ